MRVDCTSVRMGDDYRPEPLKGGRRSAEGVILTSSVPTGRKLLADGTIHVLVGSVHGTSAFMYSKMTTLPPVSRDQGCCFSHNEKTDASIRTEFCDMHNDGQNPEQLVELQLLQHVLYDLVTPEKRVRGRIARKRYTHAVGSALETPSSLAIHRATLPAAWRLQLRSGRWIS